MLKLFNKMDLRLMTVIFLMLFNFAFSQGGWDIKYIPAIMIDKSLIGKEIRIDFKDSTNDSLFGSKISKLKIRDLLSSESKINLFIFKKTLTFKENWNFYVDQGFLKDQLLVSTSNPYNKISQIYIEDIDKDNFYLKARYRVNKSEENIKLKIKKKLIKGVLVRENSPR